MENKVEKALDDFVEMPESEDEKNVKKENKNVKKVILDADPNAEKFYEKLGFLKIGQFETSIKNRLMPIMEMNIV